MTAEDEMETIKNIKRILKSQPALEGAGVRLKRAFGYNEVPLFSFGIRKTDQSTCGMARTDRDEYGGRVRNSI